MATDQLVLALQNLEVFRGLGEDQLAEIARRAERIVFKPGQTVVEAGHAGDGAFLLVAGDAEVMPDDARDNARNVARSGSGGGQAIEPGSLVGEMAMLIEHEYRITVVARSSIRALKITRAQMQAHMLAAPSLAEHFVGRVSSRLSRVAVELRRIDQMLALAAEPGPAGQQA